MWVIGEILIGWLLADLLSGVVHWVQDRVLPSGPSVLNKRIVSPAQEHHLNPMAFTSRRFLERNIATWIVTSAVFIPLIGIFGPSVWLIVAGLGGASASQVHYWTHVPGAPGSCARTAQLTGVIQSQNGHGRHHRGPIDRSYCVLTDWLNPWLDRWDAWGKLERALRLRA